MTPDTLSTRGQESGIKDKLIDLLGNHCLTIEQAANACGITVSRVSQYMSQEVFANEVQELRARALTEANETDKKWSKLENRILDRLEAQIDQIYSVDDLMKAAKLLNSRIDRGTKTTAAPVQAQQTIQLTLPNLVLQNFVTNHQQHVIQAGNQSLITIQSGNMKGLLSHERDMDRSEETGPEQSQSGAEISEGSPNS